jgi:hypothetical protein
MKIIHPTYEETLYRVDLLGEASAFIEWQCNGIAVNLPEEIAFSEIKRKIREIRKLENAELFRNGA